MTDIVYYADPPDLTNYGVFVRELPNRTASYNANFQSTYSRTWEARCPVVPGGPGEHYGPVVVATTFRQQGVYPGAAYALPYSGEKDAVARCSEVSITQSGDKERPEVYTVTATYSVGSWGANENPLLVAPSFSWGAMDMEIPLWEDFDPDGPKPICNSAGDLFDDPVMTPYSRSVLTVRINQATYSEAYASGLRNKVNGDTWNGCPPNTVLVKSISADRVDSPAVAGGYYWQAVFVFEFDLVMGYVTRRADAGWGELDGGDRKRIFDSEGNEPAQIPLLDGEGHQLSPGSPPVVLDFHPYEQISFNAQFPFVLPT